MIVKKPLLSRYVAKTRFGRLFTLVLVLLCHASHAARPRFGEPEVLLCDEPATTSSSVCGFSILYRGAEGPQVALAAEHGTFVASVRPGEEAAVVIPIRRIGGPFSVTARVTLVDGEDAEVCLSVGEAMSRRLVRPEETVEIEVRGEKGLREVVARLETNARSDEAAAVRWDSIRLVTEERSFEIPILADARNPERCPAPVLPALHPAIEKALIEWDWRMQDGIDTPREPSAYAEATEKTLRRGDALIRHLHSTGVPLEAEATRWRALWSEWNGLSAAEETGQTEWEDLWHRVHTLRRRIVLKNPLADSGPIAFVKHVPGISSHQCTQYLGRFARPGGGIFILEEPGRSMRCRSLTAGKLPQGGYQTLGIDYARDRLLFAFCRIHTTPDDPYMGNPEQYFNLYEIGADGENLRQLTTGSYDDFSARVMPSDQIVFISTRRGGLSRCGPDFAKAYMVCIAEADGSNPRPLSFHETHEWDPAVLNDGRIVYTRWDYVDRDASFYQHLWTMRQDGTNVRILYGNNTYNPMGIWEPRAIPGSPLIMGTAGAHHAMTAGSIVLVDVSKGVDGPAPLTRLTPDALFPETESGIVLEPEADDEDLPIEARRWPHHCYRSPYPLSEDFFIASYSFDSLTYNELEANKSNMFGLYLVDRCGNKELLYRDLNISSVWPAPILPRAPQQLMASVTEPSHKEKETGVFILQNVYEADPPLPEDVAIKKLRIIQAYPRDSEYEVRPLIGIPTAAVGRQVLGTVPVEADGSAYFEAPANKALSIQALDEKGQAVQVMRSITYLQPGEMTACIGCHEPRTTTPPHQNRPPMALTRSPSTIEPGPDGSKPLSYPLLVQPVLDKHCVQCHSGEDPEGGILLTSEISAEPGEEGEESPFTASYLALAPLVKYSEWTLGQWNEDFREVNSEPVSRPNHFGARGSPLTAILNEGHGDVELSDEDLERLVTWMDANALFYGTFDEEDQARQLRGKRIEGPSLE